MGEETMSMNFSHELFERSKYHDFSSNFYGNELPPSIDEVMSTYDRLRKEGSVRRPMIKDEYEEDSFRMDEYLQVLTDWFYHQPAPEQNRDVREFIEKLGFNYFWDFRKLMQDLVDYGYLEEYVSTLSSQERFHFVLYIERNWEQLKEIMNLGQPSEELVIYYKPGINGQEDVIGVRLDEPKPAR